MKRFGGLIAAVAIAAIVAVACSNNGDTAEAATSTTPPTTPATTAPTTTTAPATTTSTTPPIDANFSTGIQPILERSCASCHAAGQAGSDHFELATAADAQLWYDIILELVHEGEMPPWPASDLSPEFAGDTSLEAHEYLALAQWAETGGQLDVAPETPITPARPVSFLQDRDVVMTPVDGPYEGNPANPDEYRCLIYDPELTEPEWIIASHFEADQTEIAHHGIITMASAKLRDQAIRLDDLTPGPGWSCFGGTGLEAGQTKAQTRMGGWAPGAPPNRRPEGYAVRAEPGTFFVIQIHYHYDGSAPGDNSRFVLDLASEEQIAAEGGSYKELTSQLYLGPAEIPCYEGDVHELCDRDTALANVTEKYGPFVGALPNYFLHQCGSTPDDYAHMTGGDASSSCDLRVTNPGRITSLNGHMHELGESIRLTLNPGTSEERVLLDIPDWDFEWQFGYRPVEDIIIEADDTIRVDCGWNRERAPYEAVGYILWSDGTGDEMCYSSIETAPLTER